MTTRRTPDGQVYTEVPVVPRHDQLDGRELGNSHPISAITGLQDALDSKADAVDGGNLVTDDEKALLATLEEGAEPNVVEVVRVNGTALEPDESKAVDVTVPTAYGKTMTYAASSGKLALKGPTGTTLSEVTIPRKGVTGLALNTDTKVLTATLQDGSTVTADIGAAADPYTAGNGLALANGAFSLSSQTEGLLEDVADHLSAQTAHVSTADRAAWNGVVSNAVKTSGDQTVGGSKTFSNPVTVATPTANGHAATKAYVDAAVAGGGGGGGGGGTWTTVATTDYNTTTRDMLFDAGATGGYVAKKEVLIHFRACTNSIMYAQFDLYIPKGGYVGNGLLLHGTAISTSSIGVFEFRPDLGTFFGTTGAHGFIWDYAIDSSSNLTQTSAKKVALSIVKSATPYASVTSPAAGKLGVCIQYR